MTVYVDVLIVLNIYVNYFLLKGTSCLSKVPMKTSRTVFASIIGSLFSLVILLPDMGFIFSSIIKLTAAVIISAAAYGIKNLRVYLCVVLWFFAANFIFAGTMLLIFTIFSPAFIIINNSSIYIDFSLLTLVFSTAVAYAVICILGRIRKTKNTFSTCSIVITHNGRTHEIDGLCDTGNSLRDPFSGKPVIICSRKALKTLLDEDILSNIELVASGERFLSGFRPIPFSTITSDGLLPVFSPDRIYLKTDTAEKAIPVDALIGINPYSNDSIAIYNPEIAQ